MKILIINQFAATESESGSTRTYSFAKELVYLGHEVMILAARFNHFRQDEQKVSREWSDEISSGVRIKRVPVAKYRGNSLARVRNLAGFAWSVYRLNLTHLAFDPDVVMASSPYPFAAFAALKFAARIKRPFVLEVRDLWPQTMVDLWRLKEWNPLVLLFRGIEKRLYRAADSLITLLPGSVDYLVARGAVRDRIAWIPNGVSMAHFEPWALPQSRLPFEVLYAGTHGLANGLDTLLDAFSLLQREGYEGRIVLRLVGGGHQKVRLQSRCRDEGLRMIQFEDPITKAEVPKRMAHAHAFIVTLKDLPLYRYGISLNKIHEYLAGGRPIIFGSSACNDPVAEAGAGITVPPENAEAIADAIKSLLHATEEERVEMALRGRRYAAEHHEFAILAKRLAYSLEAARARYDR